MKVITPSLWVGTLPEAWATPDCIYVAADIRRAVYYIGEGFTVVIPEHDWETMAREILVQFGASDDRIEEAISYAR